MKSRAAIQDAHELAALSAGLAVHNLLHGLNLAVISRPDPPDAILSDGSSSSTPFPRFPDFSRPAGQ